MQGEIYSDWWHDLDMTRFEGICKRRQGREKGREKMLKSSFWEKDWALGYNSMKFWDFSDIS